MSLPDKAQRWLSSVLEPGTRIVGVRRLRLGGWHVNHLLHVVTADGRRSSLVLRRWARPGWEIADPDYTAERELGVLALLEPTPVPAPTLLAADPDGSRCDVPALLLSRLPGHPPHPSDVERDDFTRQLAATLARIHAVPLDSAAPPRLRLYYDRPHAILPAWLPRTRVWTDALAAVREPPSPAPTVLLHRDYHPENTLWTRGKLSGVVDWTQASGGPPQFDLGHLRWNLVADQGLELADRLLADYQAASGRTLDDQPYWDLVALLDLLLCDDGDDPGDLNPDDLRTFEQYAETLLERL